MLERKTILSPDRLYRYTLWRDWTDQFKNRFFFTEDPHLDYYPGQRHQYVQFIGLNPSTADETVDDQTIRVCRGFAQRWGFGAMCMTNLFAFRATEPKVMTANSQAVGWGNNDWLTAVAREAGMVVAVWGAGGIHMGRDMEVCKLVENLHHIGLTKDGHPRHPLRIKTDTMPKPWVPA